MWKDIYGEKIIELCKDVPLYEGPLDNSHVLELSALQLLMGETSNFMGPLLSSRAERKCRKKEVFWSCQGVLGCMSEKIRNFSRLCVYFQS